MILETKISLSDEELKRWNDAYAIMCEIYEALPRDCKAEAMIKNAITYFEMFNEDYIKN